jgi:hypothetical protein
LQLLVNLRLYYLWSSEMKKAAIHQPNFLPWIGYFHKMSLVDDFVFFNDVQFPRGKTFGNRVKIKTNNGELWLTVPVLSKGDFQAFNAILINNTVPWQRKSLKTIELAYSRAKHFEEYHKSFSEVFLRPYERLIDLNIDLIEYVISQLEINITLHLSSEIVSGVTTNTEDKIISILKKLGVAGYVTGSGTGSVRYIDEERFQNENIGIEWQKYKSPVYPQLWGPFIPDLSIIDLLFNCGKTSTEILKSI